MISMGTQNVFTTFTECLVKQIHRWYQKLGTQSFALNTNIELHTSFQKNASDTFENRFSTLP